MSGKLESPFYPNLVSARDAEIRARRANHCSQSRCIQFVLVYPSLHRRS